MRTWQSYAKWEAQSVGSNGVARSMMIVTYEALRSSTESCQAELLRIVQWLKLPSETLQIGTGMMHDAWEACKGTSIGARSFHRSRNSSTHGSSATPNMKMREHVMVTIRCLVAREASLSNGSGLVVQTLRARLYQKAAHQKRLPHSAAAPLARPPPTSPLMTPPPPPRVTTVMTLGATAMNAARGWR